MYQESDIVRIARRDNNPKRNFLVINRRQGKHVPASPKEAVEMFRDLAQKVRTAYQEEKLLCVGFAETATAIGATLAVELHTLYMQTTREKIPGVSYLYFSEAHSHATEQKMIREDVECVIDKVDRIVFVEDELTTGNTILNIVDILENKYPGKVKFAVASLLNGMDKQSLAVYQMRSIEVHYLLKVEHAQYAELAETYKGDGDYYKPEAMKVPIDCRYHKIAGWVNARRLVCASEYEAACERLWKGIKEQVAWLGDGVMRLDKRRRSILVLGTEEFMYPALHIAEKLEKTGVYTMFHATTRSPMIVSSEENYPVHERYELRSLYDRNRRTFVYNLGEYDHVLIITDSQNEDSYGLQTLLHALAISGNTNIDVIRWY